MSGLAAPWRLSERLLLVAVIVLAALTVVRLAGSRSLSHAASAAVPTLPGGMSPSPAGAEVVARIRSCSEQDLHHLVDHVSAMEAAGLYSQLTPADRQAVFAALPVPVVARKAKELLGVPEGLFQDSQQAGVLASSLVEAAMGTPEGTAHVPPKPLVFTTAIDGQDLPQDLRTTFRPDERRIYACLDAGSDTTGESGVLVRWVDQDSDSVVYLHYLPLTAHRRWNHVYFEVASPWPSGAYRVSFYRLGASASLLAEGSYTVSP